MIFDEDVWGWSGDLSFLLLIWLLLCMVEVVDVLLQLRWGRFGAVAVETIADVCIGGCYGDCSDKMADVSVTRWSWLPASVAEDVVAARCVRFYGDCGSAVCEGSNSCSCCSYGSLAVDADPSPCSVRRRWRQPLLFLPNLNRDTLIFICCSTVLVVVTEEDAGQEAEN